MRYTIAIEQDSEVPCARVEIFSDDGRLLLSDSLPITLETTDHDITAFAESKVLDVEMVLAAKAVKDAEQAKLQKHCTSLTATEKPVEVTDEMLKKLKSR